MEVVCLNKRKRVAIQKHRMHVKKLEEKRKATRPATASGIRSRVSDTERVGTGSLPNRPAPPRKSTPAAPAASRTARPSTGQGSEARPASRPAAPRRTAQPKPAADAKKESSGEKPDSEA